MPVKQLRFPSMRKIKPSTLTIRDEKVALAIAQRIVKEVDPDNFYWQPSEIEDRIYDVQQEIMRVGRPATVFGRLVKRQSPLSCSYGWEGIEQDCRCTADAISDEELHKAREHYSERYGR